MAYRFKNYIELGEAIKAAKPEYAERDAESLGLRFADKYGDQYDVKVEEEEERAPFAYDPEEGFNLLKTLGNVPWSAGQVVGDIATAVTNPLETAEGLGRGVAGAAEMALGTEFSPENIRVAQQMGEGIAGMAGFDRVGDEYEFTGRGIQERPLDAGSLLAGGAGAAAKGVGMAGRGLGLSRLAKGAEKVGKAAQMADPTVAVPRAGVAAARGAARGVGQGVKLAGNKLVVQPLRRRFKGGRAEAAFDDVNELVDGLKENAGAGLEGRMAELLSVAAEKGAKGKERALDWLTRQQRALERKATGAVGEMTEGYGKPVSGGGFLQGMLEQTLGFTTGLGARVIQNIIDISRLEDQTSRKIMLRAANEDYVPGSGAATIGEEVVNDLANIVESWDKGAKEVSRTTRDALRMDDVKTITDDLKLSIINDQDLTSNFGIRITPVSRRYESTVEPGTVMGQPTPLSPRTDIMPPSQRVQGAIMEGPEISYVDMEGRPIETTPSFKVENLSDVTVDLKGTPILELGENVSAVRQAFQKVFDLPPDASVHQLDIAKRAIDNAKDAASGSAQAALQRLREVVYKKITDAYDSPDTRRQLGIPDNVPVNPYVQAMAQFENYTNRLNNMARSLKVGETQTKFRGTPLEVVRQTGNPQEIVKSVMNAFGEGDKELAMADLTRLLEETGNTEFMPKLLGFSMRPVFGGGLVVRSEISQIGRGLVGFNLLSTVMAPLALLGFSPKYGGMAMSYMFSPKGQAWRQSLRPIARTREAVEQRLPGVMERFKTAGADIRKMAAEKLGKKVKDVTPNDVAAVEQDLTRLEQALQRMNQEEVTRLQTMIRGGAMEQRAEQAGEQAQQRNLLTQLSNVQAR